MNGTIPAPGALRSRPVVPPSSNPSGILYIVATPIGNLEDVTLRALRILDKHVALIAAEDTRRTRKLLNHYGISTPTTSFHQHNESTKTPALLRRLNSGESIALVSDAGTPLLSDPGARLVEAALAAGIAVKSLPGPSAAISALVISGLGGGPFVFVGFPPSRSKDRKSWANNLASEKRTIVLFEAPHRIRATLRDLADALPGRDAAVCREMTKIHEELVKGPIDQLSELIAAPKGEFTVVISAASAGLDRLPKPSDRELSDEFCYLTKHKNLDRREAIRRVAKAHGLRVREVYSAVESQKNCLVERPKA